MKYKYELSIVIVSWNTRDLLERCLQSVYKFNLDLKFEIFVIDNQSADESLLMLETKFINHPEQYPNLHIIANNFNAGFARANNQGIRQTRGRHILLLNPDTEILRSGDLKKCVEYLDNYSEVGVLGCQLLNADKTLQSSVRSFPSFVASALVLLKVHNIFPRLEPIKKYYALDFDYKKEQVVDQVMGAFFMISRSALDKVGEMDEKYWIWFEEVDYCQQCLKKGLKTIYWPEIAILHLQGQSFKQVLSLSSQKRMNKSMRRYFRKFQPTLSYLFLLPLMPMSLFLSWLVQILEKNNFKIKAKKKLA